MGFENFVKLQWDLYLSNYRVTQIYMVMAAGALLKKRKSDC